MVTKNSSMFSAVIRGLRANGWEESMPTERYWRFSKGDREVHLDWWTGEVKKYKGGEKV